MKHRFSIILAGILFALTGQAQTYNQIDETGNVTQRSENRNFNPHNNDTTSKNKVIPKGIYVWTIDRKFGDRTKAEVDTMPHLFPNTLYGMGKYGTFNTIGNNYSSRLSRIFADRKETSQFLFIDTYDQVYLNPDQLHFTNTLSPITNITYDNCGDKTNGEDHINAKFAVNADKRTGFGFDLNYAYARGYFSNQNTSHFGATLYGSYLGDQYQMHAFLQSNESKSNENGGITDDEYIVHPESFDESYDNSEIPTVLSSNWNRSHSTRLFLSHRYSVGFYRKVPMTPEELKARQFAKESKKEQEAEKEKNKPEEAKPQGRPKDAKIAGKEPVKPEEQTDTTRIKVDSKAVSDSLLAEEARQDSIDATMKKEFVPVTSFIHTIDMGKYSHRYHAYSSPNGYYADTFYGQGLKYGNDSVYDQTKMFQMKNTLAIALLEGFNKYMKAGLKVFAAHELRRFEMPDTLDGGTFVQGKWSEHNVSIGGQLNKTQGTLLHYNAQLETWVVGEDAGQLKLDGHADLNFKLFGDTVQLAAKGYFYRLNPVFLQRRYHSKNLWWDSDDLSKETRTRIEGAFSYQKTKTKIRVGIEEIQNYTYFGMSYDNTDNVRQGMTAGIFQESGNINVLTAQLQQEFRLGPLNLESVVTYQNSSNKEALPLPALNVFANLYLKFMIANVLRVELGANATYFTKYYAPDYLPQMAQFAIQRNEDSRTELGNFPFVDVYANLHLKHARFFVQMTNVTSSMGNRQSFLVPHYPQNNSVLHIGVSWNFFN